MRAYNITCADAPTEYVVLTSESEVEYVVLKKFLCQVFNKTGGEVAENSSMVLRRGVWHWESCNLIGTMMEVSLIA